ncbi:hypothetical protein JCM11491_006499 [Sporobolomyces phaffii]
MQRCFLAFGLLSPVCFLIDAPFGRFTTKSKLSINGSIGWFVMEIVSPLAFLAALPLGQSSAFPSSTRGYLSLVRDTFFSLPIARAILVVLFIVHYVNRSTISTLANPSRAKMNPLVPLSAIAFNIMNGSTMGMWVGGGHPSTGLSPSPETGLRDGIAARGLFVTGLVMWAVGFGSNIYHDHVLYDLKRDKLRLEADSASNPDPKQRYSIPPRTRGLYRYVSHPSYSSEWLEWLGYLVCCRALSTATSPFPPRPLGFSSSSRSTWALSPLVPLEGWYLQPPALFLWQEIGVMLPRARSGHKWYERTFGSKEWSDKGQKWVVIPGIY